MTAFLLHATRGAAAHFWPYDSKTVWASLPAHHVLISSSPGALNDSLTAGSMSCPNVILLLEYDFWSTGTKTSKATHSLLLQFKFSNSAIFHPKTRIRRLPDFITYCTSLFATVVNTLWKLYDTFLSYDCQQTVVCILILWLSFQSQGNEFNLLFFLSWVDRILSLKFYIQNLCYWYQ